ncbi:MAG TPA: CBASS cGAMP-activated phospholipase [Stellaceae bacterium]|nr:CBASS cGAMP-activated phospholipase [Stellaceae bacterium]
MRRILTIDGGGIKGVFPAALLAEIEEGLGAPIYDYFDLIAGTSTGGIIAMGLALGETAGELLQLYKEHGPAIFPARPLTSNLRRLLRAKYSLEPLRVALEEAFGDRRVGDCRKRLLVPALDLATERVYIYKTAHHPSFVRDYRVAAVDVGLATVAAPTYFPIHLSEEGAYVDGSLWARNPLALAVVEAIGVLGWAREDIRVLSLGCTSRPLAIAWHKRASLGASYWGGRIADVFMKAQSSSAIAMAHTLVGSHNVFRISPETSTRRFTLDGVHHMPELEALGRDEGRRALDDLGDVFFAAPAAAFTPCHSLGEGQSPAPRGCRRGVNYAPSSTISA